MMQMRARAFALRDVFPDVLRGVNIAEEARDMPVERTWARPRSSNRQAPGQQDRIPAQQGRREAWQDRRGSDARFRAEGDRGSAQQCRPDQRPPSRR